MSSPIFHSKAYNYFRSSNMLDGEWIDLNTEFINHPRTTFLMTACGDSMEEGICHGDQLLVDRSLEPTSGNIAIIDIDGEFTVKRLSKVGGHLWLVPDNKKHKAVEIGKDQCCEVWGIVTYIIKKA
jgi:DNA polymerase V